MPHALQFLVLTVAGWVNRHQEDLIDYLREENRILREQRGPRPLRLTDAQRRRLAVRGKRLGRRALMQVAGIVTPDTILRWYRKLIAQKYDGSPRRRRGRPMTPPRASLTSWCRWRARIRSGATRGSKVRLPTSVTRLPGTR